MILGIGACSAFKKSTLGEMRESGPTRLIEYCADYKCAHSVVFDASRSGDDARLSDLEPKFTCRSCGHRGVDVRPLRCMGTLASHATGVRRSPPAPQHCLGTNEA
jgi:hypothetical protein